MKNTICVDVFNTVGKRTGNIKGEPVDIHGIPCIVHKAVPPHHAMDSGWWVTCVEAGVTMMGKRRGLPTRKAAIEAAGENILHVGVDQVRHLIHMKLLGRS